jgi:hypothetical protein
MGSAAARKGPEMALAIFALGVVGPARPRFWRRRQLPSTMTICSAKFDQAAAGQQLDALADIVDLTFEGQRGRPFLTKASPPRPAASAAPSQRPQRHLRPHRRATDRLRPQAACGLHAGAGGRFV